MKKTVRIIFKIIFILGFIAGLGMLIYPWFANRWNNYNSKLMFEEYQLAVEDNYTDQGLKAKKVQAREYNERLQPIIIPDSFIQNSDPSQVSDADTEYFDCLNPEGDGIMGYVSVPKIDQMIPIYHTTAEDVLQKGAGHLPGSSLPIGGESSHSVIAAHRGLVGRALFTDLDQLEEKDQFYLYILDEIHAYEVDSIQVVKPEETESLNVVPGEDLVTLVTCTPYGVNTERLLVRGHRIPYSPEAEQASENAASTSVHTNYLLWIGIGVAAVAASMLLTRLVLYIIDKKKSGKK